MRSYFKVIREANGEKKSMRKFMEYHTSVSVSHKASLKNVIYMNDI